MKNKIIYIIPLILMVFLFFFNVKINKYFDYVSILNIELTFYLAIIAIMPLFDVFEKMGKVEVNSFKSMQDVFIEKIVSGIIVLFIIYFLYGISFVDIYETLNVEKTLMYTIIKIYWYIMIYFYILNLFYLFDILKSFLCVIKNSNLK